MMHDAIRADILKATLGVQLKDAAMVDEAKKEADEHIKDFSDDLKKNLALPLTPDLRAALQKIEPALKAYGDEATKFTELAGADVKSGGSAAAAALPAFLRSFATLEKLQGDLSDKIESYSQSVNTVEIDDARYFTKKALVW